MYDNDIKKTYTGQTGICFLAEILYGLLLLNFIYHYILDVTGVLADLEYRGLLFFITSDLETQ